ncbi:hypothetical protein MBANPS3_012024 [Mucor bainieri]
MTKEANTIAIVSANNVQMKYEERDGVMIQGSSLSVDTRIRREAIDLIDEGIPTDSRRYKLMTLVYEI